MSRRYSWENEGRPVSTALVATTSHGITVSLPHPRELRNRGYASACVAALSQQLLDAGWHFCTLYTDLANPTSNSIYQRIGYRPVCDSAEYHFMND
jgi:predicted GNAT family acetyltransferase